MTTFEECRILKATGAEAKIGLNLIPNQSDKILHQVKHDILPVETLKYVIDKHKYSQNIGRKLRVKC